MAQNRSTTASHFHSSLFLLLLISLLCISIVMQISEAPSPFWDMNESGDLVKSSLLEGFSLPTRDPAFSVALYKLLYPPSPPLEHKTLLAKALGDYLNKQRWRASLARTQGSEDTHVTILGTIQDLSIDAASGVTHTDLSAKNTLALQIINRSDDSTVRERVSGSGTDQVFWFEPEDAQALTTELFESNFQKFVNDVRIDGRTIRLK